jgi:hypothetical protein
MTGSISKRLVHLAALLAIALSAGCAEMVTVRIHEPVNVKALGTTLRVGVSTREDVIAALGVPVGSGRAMLPIDTEPRTVWFYMHSVASAPMTGGKGKLDVVAVFVYFKGDRYDGSLYGSAFPK